MNIIKRSLSVVELLAGLTEEASEVAQAALKLRRVYDQSNPTPMREDEAIEKLYEEVADVQLYLQMIDIPWNYIDEIIERKRKRWEERIREQNAR